METQSHDIKTLFEQLGLDNSDKAIDTFISEHRPLPDNMALPQADFWNSSQSAFLEQSVSDDADWAIIVDTLDAMLR